MDRAWIGLFNWRVCKVFGLCREVVGHISVKIISHVLFGLRKFGLVVKRWRPRWLVHNLLTRPTSFLSEVCIHELFLALQHGIPDLNRTPRAMFLHGAEFLSS